MNWSAQNSFVYLVAVYHGVNMLVLWIYIILETRDVANCLGGISNKKPISKFITGFLFYETQFSLPN